MTPLGIVVAVVGAVLIVAGWLRLRGPLAGYRRLQETQANLKRYDEWRGSRVGSEPDTGPTGADEMMRLLRRQAIAWGVVLAVGVALLLVGLLMR